MSKRVLVLLMVLLGAGAAAFYTTQVGFGAGSSAPPSVAAAPPPAAGPDRVSALGRLEPKDGVLRVAGPSDTSVVISRLLVDEGDLIKKGQRIAVLDTAEIHEAEVVRLTAKLENAERELKRYLTLNRERVSSESERDARELGVKVGQAALRRAKAERARAYVISPIEGQVIEVHAHEGERVGPEGIVELGRTGEMYAIAEVYETDVGRVKVGQIASVTSPALPEPLSGKVEWINLAIGKQDALGTDPASRKDARVVEVEIRLDESEQAAALTHLQVQVEIGP